MNSSNADAGENVFGRITRKYTAQIRKYKDKYISASKYSFDDDYDDLVVESNAADRI